MLCSGFYCKGIFNVKRGWKIDAGIGEDLLKLVWAERFMEEIEDGRIWRENVETLSQDVFGFREDRMVDDI